jgi:2'-5' RNA ligase
LFLALWPDADTRRVIAAWQKQWSWPAGARLVAPQDLHLTMHFIGQVDAQQLPLLKQGLTVDFEAFEIELGHAEQWSGGLALLSPERLPGAMLALHARMGEALLASGLKLEARTFRPHLTLARRAVGAAPPAEPMHWCWRVNGYALVQSLQGYQPLQHYR